MYRDAQNKRLRRILGSGSSFRSCFKTAMRSENWHHPSVTDCVARSVFVTAFGPAWETCFPSMRDKANNASCHECFAAPLPAGRCAHANLIFVCVQATPFEWVYEAFAWQSSTSPVVGSRGLVFWVACQATWAHFLRHFRAPRVPKTNSFWNAPRPRSWTAVRPSRAPK